MYTADALSRAPLTDSGHDSTHELQQEVDNYVYGVLANLPATEPKLNQIRETQHEDEVCSQIIQHCFDGWPGRTKLPGAFKPYAPYASELSVQNGLLMKGERIVIPCCMRLEMLDRLHDAHQGIVKCRERAKQSVWWPGLSRQLEEMVKSCLKCLRRKHDVAEPMMESVLPDLPWQKVGTDLCEINKNQYLVTIDYYSRYIEVHKM